MSELETLHEHLDRAWQTPGTCAMCCSPAPLEDTVPTEDPGIFSSQPFRKWVRDGAELRVQFSRLLAHTFSRSPHLHDRFSVGHCKPHRVSAWNEMKASWGTSLPSGSGVCLLSSEHLFCYSIAVRHWACYFTFLTLSFLICEVGEKYCNFPKGMLSGLYVLSVLSGIW